MCDLLIQSYHFAYLLLASLLCLLHLGVFRTSSITVGNCDVMRLSVVKNLGFFIDDKLSMNSHINKFCNTLFYYLHDIKQIRKHLSRKSTETLIHAFVSSRLNYCNRLLYDYGLPQAQTDN